MFRIPLNICEYIVNRFKEQLSKQYSVDEYIVSEYETISILDDSLVIVIQIYSNDQSSPKKLYTVNVEELTYNAINFKYNHSLFVRQLEEETGTSYLSISFTYTRFRGYTRLYWNPDQPMPIEYYDKLLPQLQLRSRYESWIGILYYFIVIEIEGNNLDKEHVIAFTITNPHEYIRKFANRMIKKKSYSPGDSVRGNHLGFERNFKSWKKQRVVARVNNYLSYFIIEEYHKEKSIVWRRADEIEAEVKQGKYREMKRIKYSSPENKWKSEQLVYNLVKQLYKGKNVIYQHRPYFLRSSIGGQMSYDVYISKINVAIEYQGKQHFEPVDFFGGVESFYKTRLRDKEKLELSIKNEVKLVYINYWEEITETLIQQKIEEVLLHSEYD